MAATLLYFLALVVFFLSIFASEEGEKQQHSRLLLRRPVRVSPKGSSAGRLLAWTEDSKALEEVHAGAAIIELRKDGVALPMYTNVNSLCYVMQGRAQAGLIKPNGEATNVRYIRVGDILALPAGWSFWAWNGARTKLKMFCVSNEIAGGEERSYEPFFLVGGNKEGKTGSILHGFSDKVLSSMWEMDPDEIKDIIESQKETGFIHAENSAPSYFDNDEMEFQDTGDFAFNMETARPDLISEGGSLTLLGDSKMKALREMQLGALVTRLNSMSMYAPQWSCSGGQIIHVTKGEGRAEISSHTGEQLMGETVRDGDVFVVPPMHPHLIVNHGRSGVMEWVCIHFSPKFLPSYLAGPKSVFKSMPVEVLAAAFNVSQQAAQQLQESREHDGTLFGFGHSRSSF